MAIYDAVFWEREPENVVFNVLKAYKLMVIRVKPPSREALKDFFDFNTTGIIFTDKPEDLSKIGIKIEPFVIGIANNNNHNSVETYADLVLAKETFQNGIPKEQINRILRLIHKARIIAESRAKIEKETEEELEEYESLSQREQELYNVLKTYPNGLNTNQICSMLGWKANALRVYVVRLKNKGYNVILRNGRYVLQQQN